MTRSPNAFIPCPVKFKLEDEESSSKQHQENCFVPKKGRELQSPRMSMTTTELNEQLCRSGKVVDYETWPEFAPAVSIWGDH